MTNTLNLIKEAQSGNEEACEKIIKENTALVWSIVRHFTGRGTDADDLYQLGCLGLLKAIRGFDCELGNQFSTYAVPKISGEIRRFLRDDGTIKVSRTIKERAGKIKRAYEQLCTEYNREPTVSEIATVCNLTIEEIAQAECAMTVTDSLNREIGDDGQTLEDVLGSNGIEENMLEYISLSEAIKELNKREQTVIKFRFFRCMTQTQTARIMKISQVQVSRIERSALKNLRLKL